MPTATDVFALSEHLAAKADPDAIRSDAAHLSALRAVLTDAVTELSARLDLTRRQVGESTTDALERDQEIHRLASRAAVLRRFGIDMCLGRMVFVSGETVYVGRASLAGPDGVRLLVDWRSPAAEPFFAATQAAPMGLHSRRRYRWHDGHVVDYWDEAFTEAALADHAGALDEQSAFVASLGVSRSQQMRDVLGTIQADQDAIVRAGSRGALVVDGGPGTGKTVVALHRTAYLLYADPRLGHRRGGVLCVGPHRPYLGYVADVLPGLGEEGVQVCTLADLVPEGEAAVPEADPTVAAMKSSVAMVEAIEPAVALSEEPPRAPLVVATPWADLHLGAADWAEVFTAFDPGTPHNEARDQVWEALLRHLLDQVDPDDVPTDLLRRELRANADLVEVFARAWPILDPADVVEDLWTVPALLRRCAPHLSPNDVALLQRSDLRRWTEPDLPLLDAARARVGDPDAPARHRRAEATARRETDQRQQVIDQLVETDQSDLGIMSMLRGDDLQATLAADPASGTLEFAPDGLAGPFAHVVVDEAQELTDAQWQMLLRRCPSRSLTVVGDRAQSRHGFGESWPDRLHRVGLDEVRVTTLDVNYRTPAEVMAAAAPVIRAVLPDANVPRSIRPAGPPVQHGHPDDLPGLLNRWVTGHPDDTACVISTTPVHDLPARVRLLTPQLSKGLEFDLVVLLEPETFGAGVPGAVDRYVAMTRATQQLVVLEP